MRNKLAIILCSLLTLTIGAAAQAGKPKEVHRTVTEVLDHTVSNLEREFIPAAEAMPEDKFDFAPTNGEFKGVRTFAQQIKHVAAVNYELGAAILEEKPPVDVADEEGPASITSKADVLKFLKDSFAYVHKAIETINEKNVVGTVKSPFGEARVTRLGLAAAVGSHGYDHYGQMAVYLRMNGVVPPASRNGG
jgi:uncharacterized damage-inducible protein DinB